MSLPINSRLLRVTLETDEDGLIHMTFTGVRDGANHYFPTVPRFETAAPQYAFLNRLLAVGIGENHRGDSLAGRRKAIR
jgi:hypothetical protein